MSARCLFASEGGAVAQQVADPPHLADGLRTGRPGRLARLAARVSRRPPLSDQVTGVAVATGHARASRTPPAWRHRRDPHVRREALRQAGARLRGAGNTRRALQPLPRRASSRFARTYAPSNTLKFPSTMGMVGSVDVFSHPADTSRPSEKFTWSSPSG